jgi:hypothetical protein
MAPVPGCDRPRFRDRLAANSQVIKYLESRDVDEVRYTLRTASLMTGPEYFFDDRDPSGYRLFGIRYLIVPAGREPPVLARLTMRAGRRWSGCAVPASWSSAPPTTRAGRPP